MERVYNFAAGPSAMPVRALEEAQRDMLNYKGTGMSVMEMSHRSKMYQASSILDWRIPWTEEPGGLQSVRLQRDGHD